MLNLVLSGGPCSGKSTSISKIESELTEKLGMKVLIVPETATELIANGIAPGKDISLDDFQTLVLQKQLEKEAMYQSVAYKYYDPDKVVIIYDRGILDIAAYMEKENYEKLLDKYDLTLADVVSRYDTIIHLVTSAKGTNCYTTANNVARRESAEEAIIQDDKTLASNMYHPHVKVVDNNTNFEQKIQKVLDIIFGLLNAPKNPSEIERKYLIKMPSKDILDIMAYSSKSNIIQTYLKPLNEGEERRIRQRGTDDGGYSFYYTEKTPISNIERIEKEKKISINEYVSYLNEADINLHQIFKTRYCFIYENQYFELDIYPFEDKYAIVEIELNSTEDEVIFPTFFEVVKEVTNDKKYKNYNIAKTLKLDFYNDSWTYETGRCEIQYEDTYFYDVFTTEDKEEALKAFKECDRNYLNRSKVENGRTISQGFDARNNIWLE